MCRNLVEVQGFQAKLKEVLEILGRCSDTGKFEMTLVFRIIVTSSRSTRATSRI